MSKNVELANVIKNFINKHWANTNQVEWPKFDFNITGVSQIEIKEDSLNKISNIWTFKGSALITIEDRSKVKMNKKRTIIGNAIVKFYSNAINQKEQISEVIHVVITKINETL